MSIKLVRCTPNEHEQKSKFCKTAVIGSPKPHRNPWYSCWLQRKQTHTHTHKMLLSSCSQIPQKLFPSSSPTLLQSIEKHTQERSPSTTPTTTLPIYIHTYCKPQEVLLLLLLLMHARPWHIPLGKPPLQIKTNFSSLPEIDAMQQPHYLADCKHQLTGIVGSL